ncbi:hypothetical protein CIK73_06075 [Brachybacterium alimentarium]|uniref:glutaredoxin domain-containing protein n=1 Tax=Brachybacterium alimentarium TaxID=47845 RepID=UPI000DF3A7F7|nr:glutaredoxin domain-containing protein [Brachybacterium alimentarium]RCS69487.1 hypothetical protein CIK73_06075 [Brachybacterium alimentarium]
MQIAIAPAYGNAAARRHWADTLDQQVDFWSRRAHLAPEQLNALERLHPDGRAHFWGGTAAQDRNVGRLNEGDFVLFTGKNMVRGIGEVGVRFQNGAFADTMWAPHADRGSWRNVYSLQSFTPVLIPYDILRTALDSSPNDNFMGMRIVTDEEKIAAVADAFGLASESEFTRSVREAEGLLEALGNTEVVDPEANNTSGSSYTRTKAEITFTRAESALVGAYVAQLPENAVAQRLRIDGRLTDLYVRDGHEAELIEAKSGSSNAFVRQALAQSLDYATSSSEPITRVSALFPSPPSDRDVRLLHRFGIDCISRTAEGTFTREAAPSAREAWQSTSPEMPRQVTLYMQPDCVGCAATERALTEADVPHELIDLNMRPALVEAFEGELAKTPAGPAHPGQLQGG